jgi:hypothetical protein
MNLLSHESPLFLFLLLFPFLFVALFDSITICDIRR